ncbi:flagellar assembly protein FliH [Caminibacter sp.]
MSKIVNGGKSDKHIIKPYKFKSLEEINNNQEEFVVFSQSNEESQENISQSATHDESSNTDPKIIESLLEKIEELSNKFVKAQMDFEKSINECHQKAAEEAKKSFEEGYQKGSNEAKAKCEEELSETKKLYQDSIKKLDEINAVFEKKLEAIEKELIAVALDIAKEVIQSEISENSKQIALNLAKSLMEDLKNATKVTIKVNPKDAEYLKENLKGIEVIEDEAIKPGGIVIMSDVGNIDGEIEERYKAVKEAVGRR